MSVPTVALPVRALNAAGRMLAAVGIDPVRLEPARLLAAAEHRTGLSDWGDARFREALDRYLEACCSEARLSLLGRIAVQRDTLRILSNRLQLIDERKGAPEIARERIERPLFVVGMPRTGTSILHELLALDPENRTPLTWETMWPCPRPRTETFSVDPRIQQATDQLAATDRIIPDFRKMHRMGAELPQECVMFLAQDFLSMQFHTSYRVPSFQDWLDHQDLVPAYEFHRRQLQHLQSGIPTEHWVLKSPQHLWFFDALLHVYPDAQVIHTHRDPARVVASVASLVCLLRAMCSDEIDPEDVGRDWLGRISTALERGLVTRSRRGGDGSQFFDMHFHEYLADPVGMVRRIYRHFGRELSDAAAGRMQAYLVTHPADEHGSHRYVLSDFGLEPDAVRERMKRYQEYFDVPSEDAS